MTSLFFFEPELVIGLNKKIICVNPNDLQLYKEIYIPNDLTQYGLNPTETFDDRQCENAGNTTFSNPIPNQNRSTKKEETKVQNALISPNHLLLAVTTSGQKAVLLYQLRLENAKIVSVRGMPRNSSALTFTEDSRYLLVTDKAGDCYQYDCWDYIAPPKLLLGHLSIVYDIKLTKDDKYIITCDRDEKIRVTNYPETHEIEIYCLGHKEFVSAIELLNDETLLSVSGDKTLRIWNYIAGEELFKYELPAPALNLSLYELDENNYRAAICFYEGASNVGIFNIKQNSDGSWLVEQHKLLNYDMEVHKTCFGLSRLYVVGSKAGKLQTAVEIFENSAQVPENWVEMINTQFEDIRWTLEDKSAWFKKKFDNVSVYMEKKKRRMQQIKQKNNI